MSRTARALGDVAGYLVEMKLHGFGVGLRQGECRACSARWTDGTEEVAVFIALVTGCRGRDPRLAHCRTTPFFWPIRASSWNQISTGVPFGTSARCRSMRARSFFESRDDLNILPGMMWARAHAGEADFL
jgi:hypothetical protein